jgi:predicted ATPase
MIERLYLDNLRSFVNFEWRPEQLSLLLGRNGAGKTGVFDALEAVQRFVTGTASVSEAFPEASRTRWETRLEQTIELDLRLASNAFHYRLVIAHDDKKPDDALVQLELLQCDGRTLVEFKTGDLRIYRGAQELSIPGTRPTRSGVGAMTSGGDPGLDRFQQWMRDIWVLRPDPRVMSSRIDRRRTAKAPWLNSDLSNFAAWYPPTLASKPGSMFKATKSLEPILDGFVELYEEDGALFARFDNQGTTSSYSFDELSDGERALIGLYIVVNGIAGAGKTVLLDEPDNYVALREVQPWLSELTDRTLRKDGPQVLLISHHPDTLNFLAVDKGWRVFREKGGPTRIERFRPAENTGAAETMAQGWETP